MDGLGATQHELNPRWCLAYDTIDRHDIDRLIDWLRTYPRLTKGLARDTVDELVVERVAPKKTVQDALLDYMRRKRK